MSFWIYLYFLWKCDRDWIWNLNKSNTCIRGESEQFFIENWSWIFHFQFVSYQSFRSIMIFRLKWNFWEMYVIWEHFIFNRELTALLFLHVFSSELFKLKQRFIYRKKKYYFAEIFNIYCEKISIYNFLQTERTMLYFCIYNEYNILKINFISVILKRICHQLF